MDFVLLLKQGIVTQTYLQRLSWGIQLLVSSGGGRREGGIWEATEGGERWGKGKEIDQGKLAEGGGTKQDRKKCEM